MRQVKAPLFPVVAPRNLEGLLSTYPLTSRQSIDGFREFADTINRLLIDTYWHGGENILHNGDFLINQRAVTSLAAAAGVRLMADRWTLRSTGTTYTASIEDFPAGQTDVPGYPRKFYRITPTSVAGAGNFFLLRQGFEPLQACEGRELRATWWAKADAARPMALEIVRSFGTGGAPSADETATAVFKVNLTTEWQMFTLAFDMPTLAGKTLGTNNDGFYHFNLWLDAGSSFNARTGTLGQQSGVFDIAECYLNIGIIDTIRRRSEVEELALCSRYYEKSFGYSVVPANGNADYNGAFAAFTTRPFATWRYRVMKRVVPTVTLYNPRAGGAAGQWTTGAADAANAQAIEGTQFSVNLDNNALVAGLRWYIQAVADAEMN